LASGFIKARRTLAGEGTTRARYTVLSCLKDEGLRPNLREYATIMDYDDLEMLERYALAANTAERRQLLSASSSPGAAVVKPGQAFLAGARVLTSPTKRERSAVAFVAIIFAAAPRNLTRICVQSCSRVHEVAGTASRNPDTAVYESYISDRAWRWPRPCVASY
jgi:hypothetical protein